jgi:hypothetical protein
MFFTPAEDLEELAEAFAFDVFTVVLAAGFAADFGLIEVFAVIGLALAALALIGLALDALETSALVALGALLLPALRFVNFGAAETFAT